MLQAQLAEQAHAKLKTDVTELKEEKKVEEVFVAKK